MSFTTSIKRELVKSFPASIEESRALLQAVLKTCGERTSDGFAFVSENESVAAYVIAIAESACNVRMTLTEAVRDPKHGRDKLTFSHTGNDAKERAEEIFSMSIYSDECALAFLKGAFLGAGSCILPRGDAKTGYHLEFVFQTIDDAKLFAEIGDRFHLLGGIVERGEKFVVYCKSKEGIGDFLSVLGADNSLKTFEKTVAAREENNNRNRLENCMAGNVDRSLTVSARQVRVLNEMKESGRLFVLPLPLRQTAEARLLNPTFTYSELAEHLGISRSCLQHRLDKLMSFQGN